VSAYPLIAIIAGFVLLVWGADRFVIGASALARNLGVSPLVIGLTIVGFGTSAPEMLVSAVAAWSGTPTVGIGNALGSNITNIALVLGATALVAPLSVHSDTLRREFPILLVIMLGALVLLLDGSLGRIDGMLLLAGLGVMFYWMASLAMAENHATDPMESEYSQEIPEKMPTRAAIFWLVAGLMVLLASSRAVVWGAVEIAQWLGVSELVIGLTIVAIGTSLPELAASVISAVKQEHDIAIGNILGSNMFNLLAVLGLPGVIEPTLLPEAVLTRDYPMMIGVSVLLFAMAYGFRRPGHISRKEGALLLCVYVGYLVLLYLQRSG